MNYGRYERLVRRGLLSREDVEALMEESMRSGMPAENYMLRKGIAKHEILFSLKEYYGVPFVEFDESVIASYLLTLRLDPEQLMRSLWFPLSARDGRAEVIACRPGDPAVIDDIRRTLGVERIDFLVALPSDLIRIIEHNFDVNPGFAGSGGRTPLARVRTTFAYRRSTYAHYRTLYAKGRTGLAFIRTGVAFVVIALLFLRVLGAGFYSALEAPLLVAGVVMIVEGIGWYLPARRIAGEAVEVGCTEPTWGTCVLKADLIDGHPVISRTAEMQDAAELRKGWENLTPVMRRRFLASDRTDMAEERTSLAGHRTKLARARTGLAFARTGIALVGLGVGLMRQFAAGPWTLLDGSLIAAGVLMSAEGFIWYFGGRKSGLEGYQSVLKVLSKESIWDLVFPLRHNRARSRSERFMPPVASGQQPGVWATTGLALERTVLADRRGVMARLRTVMAVARTGLAYIRTGMSIASVGAGLLVYFGAASGGWTLFNASLIVAGLLLIIDGFRWVIPAERMRREYPYCFGDMELTIPDYGKPARLWARAIFNHE